MDNLAGPQKSWVPQYSSCKALRSVDKYAISVLRSSGHLARFPLAQITWKSSVAEDKSPHPQTLSEPMLGLIIGTGDAA